MHSKESLQPPLRRAPLHNGATKSNLSKQKADFTIASPSEEGDDDEWVSSESGAATPVNGSDTERVNVLPAVPSQVVTTIAATQYLNGFQNQRDDGAATPRAEPPPLPRIDTTRPSESPSSPASVIHASNYSSSQQGSKSRQDTSSDQQHPSTEFQSQQGPPSPTPTPTITKARSETHSPPRKSPDMAPKRQSMTRPPSTHSVTSRSDAPLRPHPLIRGHSYSQGGFFTAKPAPLQPVAAVSSDAAQALMSTASSPTSVRAGSPSSIKTTSASTYTSSPSSSQAHRQLRRTSTSSAQSSATLPTQPSASQLQLSRSNHDRQRTLSSMSTSSSFAALSSIAGLRSTPSPTAPARITSHFPPAETTAHLEAVHPLLPPPYLSAHLTVLTYRNPISQSYERVIRAKPSCSN